MRNLPAILFAIAALLSCSSTHAQCYDATIGHQLADMKGVTPVEVVYHAYPWEKTKYQDEALKHKGKVVTLEYESWIIKGEHAGAQDPRQGDMALVLSTHKRLYDALEWIRLRAKKDKIKIGLYSFFEHTNQNGDFIIEDPKGYLASVKTTAYLQPYPGKTVRDQLNYMGGANWTDNYVPQNWNNDDWGLWKFLLCCERKAAAMDAVGIKSIPQIRPVTIGEGGEKPVHPDIVRAWVMWARFRYGNEWAVWAKEGECTPEFKELLK